jgi:hypothetical protein
MENDEWQMEIFHLSFSISHFPFGKRQRGLVNDLVKAGTLTQKISRVNRAL